MKALLCAILWAAVCRPVFSQQPDPQLLAEIRKIRAIDNHAHPPHLADPGEADDESDALPCDPLEPSEPTTVGRPDNPQLLAAWKALWGYPYDDKTDAHIRELLATKERMRREQGDNYPAWVLDHLGIETELANRVALGRGLGPTRFRWVPFVDALMLPLNKDGVASASPDRKFFYAREEGLLRRYRKEAGLSDSPATLDDYLAKVVTPTLEKQKREGAVAVKFEAAYLRPLKFDFCPKAKAEAIYAKYAGKGIPPNSQYLELQDFLFRFIATEAGRLGLPVHIHTGVGCGSYFDLSGSDPALLGSVLDDSSLRKTNFVLIHGGAGPFTKKTSYLLMKPNVYADFSEQTWLLSARKLSEVVRDWLEWYPEKAMFGTDLFSAWPVPGQKEYDWEEIGWQTTQKRPPGARHCPDGNDRGRRNQARARTRACSHGAPRQRAQALRMVAHRGKAGKERLVRRRPRRIRLPGRPFGAASPRSGRCLFSMKARQPGPPVPLLYTTMCYAASGGRRCDQFTGRR